MCHYRENPELRCVYGTLRVCDDGNAYSKLMHILSTLFGDEMFHTQRYASRSTTRSE